LVEAVDVDAEEQVVDAGARGLQGLAGRGGDALRAHLADRDDRDAVPLGVLGQRRRVRVGTDADLRQVLARHGVAGDLLEDAAVGGATGRLALVWTQVVVRVQDDDAPRAAVDGVQGTERGIGEGVVAAEDDERLLAGQGGGEHALHDVVRPGGVPRDDGTVAEVVDAQPLQRPAGGVVAAEVAEGLADRGGPVLASLAPDDGAIVRDARQQEVGVLRDGHEEVQEAGVLGGGLALGERRRAAREGHVALMARPGLKQS
jgi:hypothetical protein